MDVLTVNKHLEQATAHSPRQIRWWVLGLMLVSGLFIDQNAAAQSARWIWPAVHDKDNVPVGPVHFRKSFQLVSPVSGEIVLAADDEFQVYINGDLVGFGEGYDELTKIDLTNHLRDGANFLAIRATNKEGNTGAMAAVMRFKLNGEDIWRWLATDATWKSSTQVTPDWKSPSYNDSRWKSVHDLGALGSTQPWDATRIGNKNPKIKAAEDAQPNEIADKKFDVPNGFVVQRILDSSIGSIIAMEVNEFGQLIISQENAGLLIADLSQSGNGEINIRKYCDSVKNVQGILPLNGEVFITGEGPQGLGLYRLGDKNRDGLLEPITKVAGFKGSVGEHGPHGLALGPDGMIYVSLGNATGIEGAVHHPSPIDHIYEGELIPRIEDPGGHAVGIGAPGGTIVRISIDGKHREIVATGLRNAYDLAFNQHGDLFVHDSDMETDYGMPWYRPTQVFQIMQGGEYGWRSGSAKFSDHYLDVIPPIADTGRGSPTGAVVYDHVQMPLRYHGSLFLGDWTEGRIIAVHLNRKDGTYQTSVEDFLKAQPLTVTDLTVGIDGALYFCTGGRGTEGGVYRVAWTGETPESFTAMNDPLSQVVRRPQPQTAWSRQATAKLKSKLAVQWNQITAGVIGQPQNLAKYRVRALDLQLLFGPVPKTSDLIGLASDGQPEMRSRAIRALAWRKGNDVHQCLINALHDGDVQVRIDACHALTRNGIHVDWNQIQPLLGSENRLESFAARRLLETIDTGVWRDTALQSKNLREFMQGSTALMIAEPTLRNSYDVLAKASEAMDEFVSDRDFVDLLRVIQLALDQGDVDPTKIPLFAERMANEFPAENGVINRELARILAYMKATEPLQRLPEYLANSQDSISDKIDVITSIRHLAHTMEADQRIAALAFLEGLLRDAHEGNYDLFASEIMDAYVDEMTPEEFESVLADGALYPATALKLFFKMPTALTSDQIEAIIELDRGLKGRTDPAGMQARVGAIAVLARSSDDNAMYYLREIWRREPERRNDVVLGLAQKPSGPNWPYLVSSLPDLSDDTTVEVLKQLKTVAQRPKDPQHYRHVILAGHRLRSPGAQLVDELMQHWTGEAFSTGTEEWKVIIQAWSDWYHSQFPNHEKVEFVEPVTDEDKSIGHILSLLEQRIATADLANGEQAFQKAQCGKCHRFNGQGESMGPDLSTLAMRFSQRESLISIYTPSAFISDRYQNKKILTIDGKQYNGLISKAGEDHYAILQPSGDKIRIPIEDVEEIAVSNVSAMPEGLMDSLTTDEIVNLIAYLYADTGQLAKSPSEDVSR